jgi:ABC-2 type transport system permease protein
MPFVVLMAIVLGGSAVPAASLVDEKQKRTLRALLITPTTPRDVLVAKGVMGFLLSVLMGLVTLGINRAFGAEPLLLVVLLALSALMAVAFGLLLGLLIKDMDTLFATIKGIGIFLYAPALLYLFPGVPDWVSYLFPTYYMVAPIVEIGQQGAGLGDVAVEVVVLAALCAALLGAVLLMSRRLAEQEV